VIADRKPRLPATDHDDIEYLAPGCGARSLPRELYRRRAFLDQLRNAARDHSIPPALHAIATRNAMEGSARRTSAISPNKEAAAGWVLVPIEKRRSDQVVLVSERRGGSARADIDLGEDVAHVAVDGLFAE